LTGNRVRPYRQKTVKILVIGGGGREHALVWKLRQSQLVEKIWCAPGNAGIAGIEECIPLNTADVPAILDHAQRLRPDLTVVGPELPLVLGIADEFEKRGMLLLGPSRAAAQLEGSKVFAKEFLNRHGIPTAHTYGAFSSGEEALSALSCVEWPLVLKADGLAAGKGVLVTSSKEEAEGFIRRVMVSREFGDAGSRILLEEALVGDELSFIVLADGERILPLAGSRDYKRALDGNRGPNTGGMGAFSTDAVLPAALERNILETIVQPTIQGLQKDGQRYRGFLYCGLMLTPDGPRVLEYNCRMGDPETQAIMMRADFDLAALLLQAARGEMDTSAVRWSPAASVCVVMAAAGYPGEPCTGQLIEGLEEASVKGAVVFHAGMRRSGDKYLTSGGRVLGVSVAGDTLESVAVHCYEAVASIRFEGSQFRRDIGK
jgi:phosphoribosylamine--glycine ligase